MILMLKANQMFLKCFYDNTNTIKYFHGIFISKDI